MDKQVLRNKLRHNIIIRILAFPFIVIQRGVRKISYKYTKDASYIRGLKDIHKNQRCFIIGNGPSLQPSDLDMLKNEVCFGTNRIYYIFDKTEWRPKYYISIDNDVISKEISTIKKEEMRSKFINTSAKKYRREDKNNIHYIYVHGKYHIRRLDIRQEEFSDDVSKYFSETCSATCSCIELAVYMGFTEIYLIGMDHKYAQMVTKDGVKHNDTSIQTYFSGMKNGDKIAIAYIDNVTSSYEKCKEGADRRGVRIFNATRGGYLEVYERINLDDIIRKNLN